MTKSKTKRVNTHVKKQGVNKITFKNSQGVDIQVFPVESTLLEMRKKQIEEKYKGRPINPPIVKIKGATGASAFEVTLNGDNLVKPNDEEETKRRKLLWDDYVETRTELDTELEKVYMKTMLVMGLCSTPFREDGIKEIPDGWVEWMQSYDFDVPEDNNDRMYLYLTTVLLPAESDKATAIEHIKLSHMSDVMTDAQIQGAVDAVQRKFCHNVGQQVEAQFGTGSIKEEPKNEQSEPTDDMAVQPTL